MTESYKAIHIQRDYKQQTTREKIWKYHSDPQVQTSLVQTLDTEN